MITKEEVVALRQRFGVDASMFAAMTGVADRTVYRWENGETAPEGAAECVMLALREKLDCDPDNAPKVIEFVVRAASFGGLSYLLLKLLDGWCARSTKHGDDGSGERTRHASRWASKVSGHVAVLRVLEQRGPRAEMSAHEVLAALRELQVHVDERNIRCVLYRESVKEDGTLKRSGKRGRFLYSIKKNNGFLDSLKEEQRVESPE